MNKPFGHGWWKLLFEPHGVPLWAHWHGPERKIQPFFVAKSIPHFFRAFSMATVDCEGWEALFLGLWHSLQDVSPTNSNSNIATKFFVAHLQKRFASKLQKIPEMMGKTWAIPSWKYFWSTFLGLSIDDLYVWYIYIYIWVTDKIIVILI